jgi:nucleotide-binding universal stress UspA family protein
MDTHGHGSQAASDARRESHRDLVVCGVDGSSAGRRALEWAVADTVRRGGRLRVVTCWSGYGMEAIGMVSSPEECEQQTTRMQDEVLAAVLGAVADPPEVERLVLEDRPSHALVSASLDADLLVLGSHGHGTAHDMAAGSTSQRVFHHAACPVVVVPDPRCVEKTRRRLQTMREEEPAPV